VTTRSIASNHHQPLLDCLSSNIAWSSMSPTGHHWCAPTITGSTCCQVQRPYRYPQLQKDEPKQHCETMLEKGVIRPGTSPFLSFGAVGQEGRGLLEVLHRPTCAKTRHPRTTSPSLRSHELHIIALPSHVHDRLLRRHFDLQFVVVQAPATYSYCPC
jgi:hypothetical protein